MNSKKVEHPKGGMEKTEITEEELKEYKNDVGFENTLINDEYVKKLKSRQDEQIYIEQDDTRLMFTNSCWEIQRINPLQGGNIVLEEIVRFRHVGTGKFLCFNEENQGLMLNNSSNSLNCLFIVKPDNAGKKDYSSLIVD